MAALLAGCVTPEVTPIAILVDRAPEIRVGVAVNLPSVTIGGGERLVLRDPAGAVLAELPALSTAAIVPAGAGLRVRLAGAQFSPGVELVVQSADSGSPFRLEGRDYRGRLVVSQAGMSLRAVNHLNLEEYLAGVVGAEMGRRGEPELSALRAQAVISRTFAYRALGRWRQRGYDVLSTVADQAYAGVGFEYPLATLAVQETRGEVVTWNGEIIDGFFHSTCAGRTADGTEVFVSADRPYLRSVRDQDGGGRAWCEGSPRFRWQESWTGEELTRTLSTTLPPAGGTAELARSVQDFRIVDRTPTGRVARLEILGSRGALTVTGPAARLILRNRDGAMLRSASFNLQLTRSGSRIVQLLATGSGAGHGVGMCQWGALARSRAGFTYPEILTAYFPGTQLTRTY